MASRITIDPLTRIEGHLKVEVEVNNGRVSQSEVSGTMARGFESLLLGRDPRDATYVTERICGVCFAAHGWTSSLAVEMAHGTISLPEGARILRNLIVGACWLHDHVLHFYHLSARDYLNMGILAGYQGTDSTIRKVRDLVKAELDHPPVEGEYAGPLMPSYAPDEFSVGDLGTLVTMLQHYFQALKMQVKAKKLSALLGGKQPHQSGIVAGGVTSFPDIGTIATFVGMLEEQIAFVNNVYVQDVMNLTNSVLLGLAKSNVGVGYQNYLSFGGFPENRGGFLYPEGAVIGGNLVASSRSAIEPVIMEDVTRAWYLPSGSGHPTESQQSFDNDKLGAYSFIKAPRFDGQPMEVGPLARMMIAHLRSDHPAHHHPAVQKFGDLIQQGFRPGVVTRHVARALETLLLCNAMSRWVGELKAMQGARGMLKKLSYQIHDTEHWEPPVNGQGLGMTEAPRGALGHWIKISQSKIGHYACVVPTTWNASPTDSTDRKGPIEEALMDCPVPDTSNPINLGRVVRSFDPCIACAVHMITPGGNQKKFIVNI